MEITSGLVQIAGNYADDFASVDISSADAQGSVRSMRSCLCKILPSCLDHSIVWNFLHTRLPRQLVHLVMYSYVCIRYC